MIDAKKIELLQSYLKKYDDLICAMDAFHLIDENFDDPPQWFLEGLEQGHNLMRQLNKDRG